MSVAENIPSRKRLTGTRVTGIHPREEKVSAVSTYTPKAGDTTRTWYVIDAQDVVLGRLAVAAANLLRGKHKPTFTPNTDGGDFVIIVNAEKIALTEQLGVIAEDEGRDDVGAMKSKKLTASTTSIGRPKNSASTTTSGPTWNHDARSPPSSTASGPAAGSETAAASPSAV